MCRCYRLGCAGMGSHRRVRSGGGRGPWAEPVSTPLRRLHQIETPRNGVGPHLQGVIGREAGGIEGFNYSPVLRDSGITWNAETLETYLSNPAAMVRGTRMTQRFNDADERRAIIEFLASERQHDLAKAKQLGTRSIMVGFTAISERLAPDALVDATRPGSCAVGTSR